MSGMRDRKQGCSARAVLPEGAPAGTAVVMADTRDPRCDECCHAPGEHGHECWHDGCVYNGSIFCIYCGLTKEDLEA